MGQRRLVFPQGKEEICKEEVVESLGAVAESRQIDLENEGGVTGGHQGTDGERALAVRS